MESFKFEKKEPIHIPTQPTTEDLRTAINSLKERNCCTETDIILLQARVTRNEKTQQAKTATAEELQVERNRIAEAIRSYSSR